MGFYSDYAARLAVIAVHQRGNPSGYWTPPELYTPYQPFHEQVQLIHATVGTNTLPYFASKVDAQGNVTRQAGSLLDGRQVCAHQLIPKDDYTIYDMVPPGFGCGHCNPGVWRGIGALNFHARGYELENLQNGDNGDQFTESQYIKLALTIAYHAAIAHTDNLHICSHWDASMGAHNVGGHTDPNSGPFSWAEFYEHLAGVRSEAALFQQWGIPYYKGR